MQLALDLGLSNLLCVLVLRTVRFLQSGAMHIPALSKVADVS
jgi:hypothetical protein